MVLVVSSGLIMPFVLLIVTVAVGGLYVVVDFFVKYWTYFAIASGILLVIKSISAFINSYAKWHAFLFLIFEIIRIPLTYLTLVWYANDWAMEFETNILSFVIKVVVEGIFVVVLTISGASVPLGALSSDLADEFSWALPLIGIGLTLIPLGLRILVEYVNTGAYLPVELLAKMGF